MKTSAGSGGFHLGTLHIDIIVDMNVKTFVVTLFIACAYAAWPNLAKAFKVGGGLVNAMVVAVTAMIVFLMARSEIAQCVSLSRGKLLAIFLFGVANGLAVYLFGEFVAKADVATGMFQGAVFALVVLLAPLADWLVTRHIPTW